MLKKLDFENWSQSLEDVFEKYFGQKNNSVDYFNAKNISIGWKDPKLTEKHQKNKIIIQNQDDLMQQKQEEMLLKEVNQLNKKVKIMNNQLNNKSNSDNNQKIHIKDQNDQVHAQNLFLLNECNKLVEERTMLKEDLQQMIKTFELISQEIEMTSGEKFTKEELDIYQLLSKKDNFFTPSSKVFYSPRTASSAKSPLRPKRDTSAGNTRNYLRPQSPNQVRTIQRGNSEEINDRKGQETEPMMKMKRLLKDIEQFKKLTDNPQEEEEQIIPKYKYSSSSNSPRFRSIQNRQNSEKNISLKQVSSQSPSVNQSFSKPQIQSQQQLNDNKINSQSKTSSISSVKVIPVPNLMKINSQQQ